MNNNPSLNYIKNRLSLRKPQSNSLDVLDSIIDNILSDISIKDKIKYIKDKYEWFTDFDRDFPSLCFALATGVGKTRLMGAFIAYLYITKNIKNFMIIAPNITIYNKLKKDFSDDTLDNEKYVFKGLKEFVQNKPKIITGENYKEFGKSELFESDITINIFNIDKINKDEQSIKSLSEYIGQSYYDYLCEIEDLVILMDESHHYRADRGMSVINELQPILGLELTATPQIERGNRTVKFNNIIYDYPLRNALLDGYVKDPFVATKKDFNPSNFSEEELDKIKILDGIKLHQNTKIKLEEYSKEHNVKLVKPFAMIICKNIEHGQQVLDYITSKNFFDGYYNKDRVLFVNSTQGKTEKDENVEKLLLLEHELNKIEIVVHVNMLKEGWDVTNLYTIIPLRRSASQTLTEQTIGRGLRLPYGKRVGNDFVDGLTIVSHDKYQEIIDEAHKDNSIFKVTNVKYVEEMDLEAKEIVTTRSLEDVKYDALISSESNKMKKVELTVEKEVNKVISENRNISKENFSADNVKHKIMENVLTQTSFEIGSGELEQAYNNVVNNIEDLIKTFRKNIINIPYISLTKNVVNKQEYINFDYDYSNIINFKPLSESIIIQHLDDGDKFEIKFDNTQSIFSSPKELLIERILMSPSIDYDKCCDIINSKVDDYLKLLSEKYNIDEIINILFNYSRYIVKDFTNQINKNMHTSTNVLEQPIIKEFDVIKPLNFTKYTKDDIIDINETVEKSLVPKKVFTGFKKAYHNIYKFDSSTEKDFTIILENSEIVCKWLRPAHDQFNLYWSNNDRYEPDFIVETKNMIYMVEIKASNQVSNEEVLMKKDSAEKYCNIVNEYAETHDNIKNWKYLLISDEDVKTNYSFDRYM